MSGVQDVGARVEELLAALRSGRASDPAAGRRGTGPAAGRPVRRRAEPHRGRARASRARPAPAMLDRLTEDPLVESLLLLHDLHPLDVDARIQRALDRVRPYLGSHAGGVEYLGVRDGVARLRLEGSCHGCPSSTVTVQLAIAGRGPGRRARGDRGRGGGHDRAAPGPAAAADRPAPGGAGARRRGIRTATASAGSPCPTSGRRARGRSPPPRATSPCWSARSAARSTPTGTAARPAGPRWPTGRSTASS